MESGETLTKWSTKTTVQESKTLLLLGWFWKRNKNMVEAFPSQPNELTASNRTGDVISDIMLALQFEQVPPSPPSSIFSMRRTRSSASVIPVTEFYNSKGVFLFFCFTALTSNDAFHVQIQHGRLGFDIFITVFPHVLAVRVLSCASYFPSLHLSLNLLQACSQKPICL